MLANLGKREPFHATINSQTFEDGYNIYNAGYRPNAWSGINAGQNQYYLATQQKYDPNFMKMVQPLGSYVPPIFSDFQISGNNAKNGASIANEMVHMLLKDMQKEMELFYPTSLNNARTADFSKIMNSTWQMLIDQRYPTAMSEAFDAYIYSLDGKYDPKDLNEMFYEYQINNRENILLNLRRQYENDAIRIADSQVVSGLNIRIMNLSELVLSDRMLVFNGIDAVFNLMTFVSANKLTDAINNAMDLKELFEDD